MVADADGSTANTSFTVSIDDDMPITTNDGLLATLSENSSGVTIGTTATLLGDDNYGADGAATAGSLVIGTGDKGGTVTIDVNGNLVYTNTSWNVVQGETVTETFTYTIKDADGDTAEATFTVNLTDTGVTIGAAPANLMADEDNLPGIGLNNASDGDDAQVLSGTISYTLGQDAIGSISLSTAGNATGLQTLAGQDVVTTFSNGTLIGYISGTNPSVAANQVFAITLGTLGASSTGYTMTLFQPVKHAIAGTEDNTTPFTVNVVVADADGSTANTSFTVSIDDDMPSIGIVQPALNVTNVAGTVFIGTFDVTSGADQPVTASLLGNTVPAGLRSGGQLVSYYVDPSNPGVLVAYTGIDPTASGAKVFALTIIPGSDQYKVEVFKPLDGITSTVAIDGSSAFGSGPQPWQILTNTTSGQLSVLTGWQATGGFNLAAWKAGAVATGLAFDSVNGSTAGWGVGNNNFTANEFMRFDFADVDDFDGPGGYAPPAFSGPTVTVATISFNGYSGNTIDYVVRYTDGTWSSGQVTPTSGAFEVMIPSGANAKFIDYIELYTPNANGEAKVDLVSLGVTNVGDPEDLTFNVSVIDADGDQDQASLTLDLRNPDPVLVVGTNVSDAGVSTTDHFIANPNLADVDGNIAGSAGADVLVGDLGGVASGSYNLTFIIDTSGSINNTELGQMKAALKTLLDKFVGVTDLQIEIGTFATGSQIVGSYSTVSDAKAAIDALTRTPGGSNTNYQAALTMANTLVANDTAADNKIVLFVTDGDPTTGNWISTTEILAGMNGLSHLSDSATAVNNIQINAIGIGLGDTSGADTSATRLNAIDNTTDGYVPIANFSDLTNGLGSIFVPVAVGSDALVGGSGSDILFGDSIHADGSDGGWAKLVADNPGLSNAQLRTLVANNHSLFGQDDSQGGDDSLDGGAGNDILYGQKGNDILTGGTGDDLLVGGSGRDTFKWQAGDADGGIDRITDFAKGSGGDILDISAVLDVSTGAPADTLATYLNFTFDSANNRTVLTIDSNGTTGGSQVNQTVYFDGVDLTGGSTDQQVIINSLLANLNLKVDD